MRSVRLRLTVAITVLLSAVTLVTNLTTAQRGAIETYAITNVRIVTMAGPAIDRGTVVMRNGLITQVGANVTAPPDARVIDGKDLTVYPGIIDANSTLGMPEAAPAPSPGGGGAALLLAQARPAPSPSGPNSTQPVGLQPEVMAEEIFRVGGDQIDSAKNAGITTVLSVPRGGIWMGQSALMNLAGDTPQQMTVRSPVAIHVGFQPLRGGTYPNSLLGVFSALRQMLFDAQNYRESKQIYERSPRGVRRPAPDRSLEALLPALDGKMLVIFHADREREIRRALDLADEFKLKAVIAGGSEAWKLADRLQKADVPVLLSVNFPRRTTAAVAQADPEPLRVLRDRVEAPKTAAKLAAAKVRFAFQSGGAANISDYLPNAGKTIENGLLKDDAIRALTIRPAEIFGVADRLGTIETGKIANLTVVRGDLFDRNSRVAHVFIDGKPVDLKPAPARPADGEATTATPAESPFAGTWSITITLGGQTIPGTLVLNQEGSGLSGTVQTSLATSQFSNGTIQGTSFRATMTATIQGQPMDLTIDARVTGNEISGTIGGTFGVANFTGSRPK